MNVQVQQKTFGRKWWTAIILSLTVIATLFSSHASAANNTLSNPPTAVKVYNAAKVQKDSALVYGGIADYKFENGMMKWRYSYSVWTRAKYQYSDALNTVKTAWSKWEMESSGFTAYGTAKITQGVTNITSTPITRTLRLLSSDNLFSTSYVTVTNPIVIGRVNQFRVWNSDISNVWGEELERFKYAYADAAGVKRYAWSEWKSKGYVSMSSVTFPLYYGTIDVQPGDMLSYETSFNDTITLYTY